MRLRLWVKIVLAILGVLAVIMFIKWDKDQYDKCMKYTNGNEIICKDSNR